MAGSNRIGALDGLRGIFAVLVMIGHFSLFFAPNFKDAPFQNVALFVQFFFILSGFALCYGYESRMRDGLVSTESFVFQRVMRIYPLHLVAMIAAGLFQWPLMGLVTAGDSVTWTALLNLFLLQAVGFTNSWSWNAVSWSISTEFWVGIIVLPLAFRYIGMRLAIALSVAGYTILYLSAHTVRAQYAFVVPGVTSGVLSTASGVLAGVGVCRYAAARRAAAHTLSSMSRNAIGLVELLLLVGMSWIARQSRHGAIEFAALAAMPCLIFSVATARSWMSTWLESKPIRWLGETSYAIYLLHVPILGALMGLGLTKIDDLYLRFAVFSSVVLVAATIANRFFERPIYQRYRYALGRNPNKAKALG